MLKVLVAVQLFVTGLYLPPLVKKVPLFPPQIIITWPSQTAVCQYRPSGALVVLVALQVSVLGLYLPPVLRGGKVKAPPQIIISVPVHTAV
jgi:hypothetical protein